MTVHRRVLIGAVIALAIVCGSIELWRSLVSPGITLTRDLGPSLDEHARAEPSLVQDSPLREQPAPDPPGAPLIEDLLRDEGEDPETIAFMTGVREAVREGNRTFALELFAKMKDRHEGSPLIAEAEALLRKEQ